MSYRALEHLGTVQDGEALRISIVEINANSNTQSSRFAVNFCWNHPKSAAIGAVAEVRIVVQASQL